MNGSTRLSFLIAGVQKAGTSALHDYLSEVPDLQLPQAKELHFFDDEERVDWTGPDYTPLHAAFSDDGRMRGEATPITLYWPCALERVRAYQPAMLLVLLFRDPVARAYSHWQMEYARNAETLSFADAIRSGRARMAASRPTPGFDRIASYVERGFYGRQITNALRLFPRAQILCLPQPLLASDPDAAVAMVCRFLGVAAPAGPIRPRRVRPAATIAYPSACMPQDIAYLRSLYATEMIRFVEQVGDGATWEFLNGAPFVHQHTQRSPSRRWNVAATL